MSDARTLRLGYQPALDGLRGLAVLAVMALHAGYSWASGGYLGVDLFFVLSGFLITTLLLEEWCENEAVSLRNFYVRRALRLLPALACLLVAYAVLAMAGVPVSPGRPTWRPPVYALLYWANWARAFGGPETMGVLNHTWSLSVEEQFYLAWPLLLLAMLRAGVRPRMLLAVIGACIVAVIAWRAALWNAGAPVGRLYFGFDTRADGLLVGCFLAVLHRTSTLCDRVPVRGAALLSVALCLILGHRLTWASRWWDFGGLTIVAFALALIVLCALQEPPAFLASPGLVWLGRISYGLYLWHFPVFRLLVVSRSSPVTGEFARWGSALGLAALSYYWVERPVLRLKGRFRSGQPESAAG